MIYIDDECKKEMLFWEKSDKKIFKRILKLLSAIENNPFKGIGKPEPLKYEFAGLWSRRIDQKNRLLYTIRKDGIWILSCKGHYDDN